MTRQTLHLEFAPGLAEFGFGQFLRGAWRVALAVATIAAVACLVVAARFAVYEYLHGQILRSLFAGN